MRTVLLVIPILILFVMACKNGNLTNPSQNTKEYVIGYCEEGFSVTDIHSAKKVSVPAVVQLNGKIYLPVFSSMPSFYKKVVEGVFIPDTNYFSSMKDTIFRVTKHLRDTTFAAVDQ